MPNNIVKTNYFYYPRTNEGKPISQGKIYVGSPNTDPTIPANQIQVSLRLEDGSTIQVSQPVMTSSGGLPVDSNGKAAEVIADLPASVAVYDSNDILQQYNSSVSAETVDASQIIYNSITVQERLDNLDVDDYAELRALTSSQLSDGDSIRVTDSVTSGVFSVRTGVVTDNGGTLIVFNDDSNRYAERIVQGYVNPEMFNVQDSVDSTTQMQAFLDYVRDNDVTGLGTGATYRCDGAITLQSDNTNPTNTILDFKGSTIDFSNTLLTTGSLFTIGATNVNNGHDKELFSACNFKILGPEPPLQATPATSLTGLFCDNMLRARLDQIDIMRVYTGIKTDTVWGLTATSIEVRETYIPFHVSDDSTLATWIGCGAVDSRYSLLVMPEDPTKVLTCQTFINFRSEGCDVGPHLDPQDGGGQGIIGVKLINPYYENITYDYNRHGIAFDFSTPETRGADRSRTLSNCDIDGGLWSKVAPWGGSRAPLVLSTSGSVKFGEYRIASLFSDVVGVPNKYKFTNIVDQISGDGTDYQVFDSTIGFVTFTGSTGAINFSQGNIASVTRVGVGLYDITPTENYNGGNSLFASGVCDDGYVSFDSANSSSTNVRIECFDNSATPVLFDPTQVRINIKGEIA
ncbi:hypothetical protein KAR91_55185 [Candidatus Pacearchaeota archaeon]|nr:hypothetical protein [Candidatus Pacearchaeota archaeon]